MSVETLVRRDRALAAAGLAGLSVLAWASLIRMSGSMDGMEMGPSMAMPMPAAWTPGQFLLTFLMWVVMMVAMMVPGAAPMILAFATINRHRAASGGASVSTGVFLAGYLAVWSGFGLLGTLGQWVLQSASLLAQGTLSAAPIVGGLLLLLAGLYQFTPLKEVCLARCVSPLGFILAEWREGKAGAFVMGLRHGAFCVGCCWALMALLFVAGVMNLLWVAVLAGLVLVEKLVPRGRLVSWPAGLLLLAWGAWVLVRAS